MAKRHRWKKGARFATCRNCGAQYRLGMISKVYEFQDGTKSLSAGTCVPSNFPGKTLMEKALELELARKSAR